MQFKQWLENVPGRKINSNQNLQVTYIDPEEDWEMGSQVDQIAKKVGIRPNSLKNVAAVALVGENVVGGLYTNVSEEEMGRTLDFDVVVDPQWQGYQNVGLKLIDYAIQLTHQDECHVIEALVVNTRLAKILDTKYGFEGLWNGWDGRPVKMYKMI